MTLSESVLLRGERARSTARAVQADALETLERTGDLMNDSLHWYREALAILRRTRELARRRAMIAHEPREDGAPG